MQQMQSTRITYPIKENTHEKDALLGCTVVTHLYVYSM